jgi:hypothetical protein
MLKDSKGNTVIIVAIVMPVLLLFLALVADVGTLHVLRSQLQTIADASSLAGCTFTQDEVFVDYLSEDAVKWDGSKPVAVTVYIQLDKDLARQRAKSIADSNLEHISDSLENVHIEYYLRGEKTFKPGRTIYMAAVEKASDGGYDITDDITFERFDGEDPNSYFVDLTAEVPTIILGPMMNMLFGREDFRFIKVEIKSKSSFDHLTAFERWEEE